MEAMKRIKTSELGRLPAVLTVEEACSVLGIGRSSGFEAVQRGIIPAVRLSERRIGVPTAALIRRFNLDGEGDSHIEPGPQDRGPVLERN
jgi:excisionase family DNA binding protein